MTSDCFNSFIITGITHEQWQDLAATFQVRDEEDEQDFLKMFYPEPDWQNIPNENGDFASGPDVYGFSFFQDGKVDFRWSFWRRQHWGTKWDVYDVCNDWTEEKPSTEFRADFSTHRSPLSEECLAVLSKHFPGALLTNYYEEERCDFCGVTIAKNGIAKNHSTTLSEYKVPFFRHKFPDLDSRLEEEGLNLEDNLDEFFRYNCGRGEVSDFVCYAQQPVVEMMIQQVESTNLNCCPSA
jgi:hypothetical protein